MRDAIAWSYELLREEEQRCFRRLAVFAGGCTFDAAAAVLRTDDAGPGDALATDIVEPVGALVDQSLLTSEHGPDSESRLRMLETIREFGLERIGADEESAARAAHAHYFLTFAQALRPLSNTRATRTPHDRLAADDANLRAALVWLADRERHADVAAMVAACWVYWYATGQLHEAEGWLAYALRRLDAASAPDRARLSIARAELLMVKGEAANAASAFATALPLMRRAGDPFDLTMALIAYGASLNYGGKYAEAELHLHEASALAESLNDPTLRSATAGLAQSNLSNSARGQGDPKVAAARSEQALRWFRGRQFDLAESRALVDLADTVKHLGDHCGAVEHYQASIAQIGERGEPRHLADALTGIAGCATAWGQHRTALVLFGAAEAVRERTGVGMMLPIDAVLVDRDRAALRGNVEDQEFESALAEGRALPLAEAIALAMAVTSDGSDPPISAAPPKRLTRREREILLLMSQSRTDREIAEHLFLSTRTVSWHVRSILTKLDAATRREAVAQARADGLRSP
jgi:non-specific serine/threonine protein kinase